MAGLSVADLQGMRTKVKDWADRNDLDDSLYDDFINIAIAKANRVLRLEERVTKIVLSVSDGRFNLPADYIETKNVFVDVAGKRWALERKTDAFTQSIQSIDFNWYPTDHGSYSYPKYFAREGSSMNIGPNPETVDTVDLYYWAKTQPLITDGATNWMIQDAATAVLYGALSEVGNFVMDDDMMMKWKQEFELELTAMQAESDKEHWSGDTLAVMP